MIKELISASLLVLLAGYGGAISAHGDDNSQLQVSLSLPAASAKLLNEKQIALNAAYLSSFSFELVPCKQNAAKPENQHLGMSLLNWLIPVAHANHGFQFSKPTQIPILQIHNLQQAHKLDLGRFDIPAGRYCHISYTVALPGKKPVQHPIPDIQRYSLYISGSTTQGRDFLAQANYAHEHLIPIDILVPYKPSKLNIHIDTATALSHLQYTLADYQLAKQFIFSLPQYFSVTLTSE